MRIFSGPPDRWALSAFDLKRRFYQQVEVTRSELKARCDGLRLYQKTWDNEFAKADVELRKANQDERTRLDGNLLYAQMEKSVLSLRKISMSFMRGSKLVFKRSPQIRRHGMNYKSL